MKMTFIQIVIGTIIEGFLKGIEDIEIRERVETIQTTALMRSDRILRSILGT